jgi:hypothetical protein
MKFLIFLIFAAKAVAFDMDVLKNTKEAYSVHLSKKERKKLNRYPDIPGALTRQTLLLKHVLTLSESENKFCDLDIAKKYIALSQWKERKHMLYELKVYRNENEIDDLFFGLMKRAINIQFKLKKINNSEILNEPIEINKTFSSKVDQEALENALNAVENFYKKDSQCIDENWKYLSYYTMKAYNVDKYKNRLERKVIRLAFSEGRITRGQRDKLLKLSKIGINEWQLNLKKYVQISREIKNVLSHKRDEFNLESGEKFNSRHFKNLKHISRRMELYKKYSPDQIIMLGKLFSKMNIRLGVEDYQRDSRLDLTYSYTDMRSNETILENYVLSPMDQYNWARRMLRKEMDDLQRSRFFEYHYITYNEVITAALETGALTLEEVKIAVTYDDLWNPHKSKWHKVRDWIFSISGSASVFLPPPYNIAATLGIIIVQGIVESKDKDKSNNEHSNGVIN